MNALVSAGDAGGERRFAGPEAEAAGDVGVREAAAALGEEERLLARIGREGAAAVLQIAPKARWAGSPTGSSRSFEPLPRTRSCSVSKSSEPWSRLTISSQRSPQE